MNEYTGSLILMRKFNKIVFLMIPEALRHFVKEILTEI